MCAGIAQAQSLPVPLLLEVEQARKGNPLAAYAVLVDSQREYLRSPLAEIYSEVRWMAEEFLGVPDAGLRAMSSSPRLRRTFTPGEVPLPGAYSPRNAVQVIAEQAARTRIVIWGEEHHLPQTRSLYEAMLRHLWMLGYRYLAAETFTDSVAATGFRTPTFASGVYVRDPVFANAVRTAIDMGYRLIPYEEPATAPRGDQSFRDRRQAENINARIFLRDSSAKVLVLAGRGHASEVESTDGWTPMASVLKRLTGIDPFTIFAVQMGERLTPEEEDPRYRFATARGLVREPTIFFDSVNARPFGSDSFDAFVFWPRTRVVSGRPDWLESVLGRRNVTIPPDLAAGTGLRLVQVFRTGEPPSAIPVDQVILGGASESVALMLPPGSFWARTIDRHGTVLGQRTLTVRATR
jgi:hypothetical protein